MQKGEQHDIDGRKPRPTVVYKYLFEGVHTEIHQMTVGQVCHGDDWDDNFIGGEP